MSEIKRLRAETDRLFHSLAHPEGPTCSALAAERAAVDAEIARLRDVLAAIAAPLHEDYGTGWSAKMARRALERRRRKQRKRTSTRTRTMPAMPT